MSYLLMVFKWSQKFRNRVVPSFLSCHSLFTSHTVSNMKIVRTYTENGNEMWIFSFVWISEIPQRFGQHKVWIVHVCVCVCVRENELFFVCPQLFNSLFMAFGKPFSVQFTHACWRFIGHPFLCVCVSVSFQWYDFWLRYSSMIIFELNL